MDTIKTSRYSSPAGDMVIGSFRDRLCICRWDTEKQHVAIGRLMTHHLGTRYEECTSDIIRETIHQLDEYFAGTRRVFTIPLLLAGTRFQQLVWNKLCDITYGTTITYAVLARRIGNPLAIRAVAAATAANPMSIIVPCHRVIGSDMRLTGYAGGLEAKHSLLSLEAYAAGTALRIT